MKFTYYYMPRPHLSISFNKHCTTKHNIKITVPHLCSQIQLKPLETQYHAYQINILFWPASRYICLAVFEQKQN